jgi:hypothetical protein
MKFGDGRCHFIERLLHDRRSSAGVEDAAIEPVTSISAR